MNTSEEWLNRMRTVSDSAVDAIVLKHLALHGPSEVPKLLHALFRTPRMPEDHPLISDYLASLPCIEPTQAKRVERGQRLFELFGPEVLLTLGSYALPLAYAAGNGVQTIARARRLKDDPVRRLCDTAQMIINVMIPGQLTPGGLGWYATRKVRLVHALIRQLVASNPEHPWNPTWGHPINQEDLAGTLLTFSLGVVDGLRKMGAHISEQQGNDYIFAWSEIGRLLGVEESLLATSESEATVLALRIGERQIRATPEGQELNQLLLESVDGLFPIRGYAVNLTHFFLKDTVFGSNVAQVLGLPKPNWMKWLVWARAKQKRSVLRLLEHVPGGKRRRSFIAKRFVQALILLKRPDGAVPFEVPRSLLGCWGMRLRS